MPSKMKNAPRSPLTHAVGAPHDSEKGLCGPDAIGTAALQVPLANVIVLPRVSTDTHEPAAEQDTYSVGTSVPCPLFTASMAAAAAGSMDCAAVQLEPLKTKAFPELFTAAQNVGVGHDDEVSPMPPGSTSCGVLHAVPSKVAAWPCKSVVMQFVGLRQDTSFTLASPFVEIGAPHVDPSKVYEF